MSISGKISIDIDFTEVAATGIDHGALSKIHRITDTLSLTDGTTVNKADLLWSDRRTLDGTENLDLFGSITMATGTAFSPVELVGLYVKNRSTAYTLTLGGHASQAAPIFGDASDTVVIGPGGSFLVTRPDATGYGVIAAATLDQIKLVSSGSLDYDIMIWGRSA